MSLQLRTIITDYLHMVDNYIKLLEVHLKQSDLLSARRKGLIPSSGVINEDIYYFFHGSGCRIEVKDFIIEFDFTGTNVAKGFDSWRLWVFIKNQINTNSELTSEKEIREQLNQMAEDGIIQKLNTYPSPHLYVLRQ